MESVKLQVIGCGDAFGSGGRLNTCFFVAAHNTRFLVDCGASSLPALKRAGIAIEEIDTIVITHFHGDHYGGVPFVILDAATTKRSRPLNIITPPGGRERISALTDLLYPGSRPIEKITVNFIEYEQRKPLLAVNLSIEAFPVVHTEEALPHGLRIKAGNRILSFSGDTSWTDELIPLSADADLFVCECNFYQTQVKGHLSYIELESRLSQLTCKRLLLNHFDHEMLSNMQYVKPECATDGLILHI
ncbi:MBL fold metallo-hydrolase [Pedobacter deserti]|uniref:MBL fold metallo-hydrolase n=1 Tax=Pedobacter deserti TaxID=2817382 RepID=UPI0021086A0A|nr:MBL fold metallo-hydrolase [Pedobacter sp. SYSU D00382]